jgi:hypothetical protein
LRAKRCVVRRVVGQLVRDRVRRLQRLSQHVGVQWTSLQSIHR